METRVYDLKTEYEAGLAHAVRVILSGGVVAFPTETVYGLAANAFDMAAVRRIFEIKGRPADNPLIVHLSGTEDIPLAAKEVPPLARRLFAKFSPGPFTGVLNKQPCIPDIVSAGLPTVGIRIPANEYARELIRRAGVPIAAPSANLSGRPSPTTAEHCIRDLFGKVPVILDGGACSVGVESTVALITGEYPVILRPGGVTREMLALEAGRAEIASGVTEGLSSGEVAASPGMKYRHYSPNADVYIVEGDINTIANKLRTMYDNDIMSGLKPLILCSYDMSLKMEGRAVRTLGRDADEIAKSLFSELRRVDETGYDKVYFEAQPVLGLGLAVMNRAIRAAGFKTI